ncbi:MAG: histidine kinase [Atopobiaceae bacterium]|nr:histidine kinase [Atopobiaceae bacterium]
MFSARELNIAIELWGAVLCVVGIASVLVLERADRRYRTLLLGMFATMLVMTAGDAFAGMGRGVGRSFAWVMVHVGNLATFVGGFLLVAFVTRYLCERIEEVGGPAYRGWRTVVAYASVTMCVLAALGLFYQIDDANIYHRSDWYWVAQAFPLVVDLANCALIWRHRRELGSAALVCLTFFVVSPAVASLAQIWVYGLNLVVVASVIGLVVAFLEMQQRSTRMVVERTEALAQSRVELTESRIAVMVSQIQPHFLFNTLDTIYGLVDEDTEKAKEAIASFSRYLRTNLDSLKHNTPVPIEREMEHVRTYLELERMSDEGRLEYELDVQATGFDVPALSVQTIAENAVKHGLGRRERGGRVIVRTREQASEYTVAILDDGVGFDVEVGEGSGGVGLSNTRARLEAMCGGTLDVTSEEGVGTIVVMHVPKATGRLGT